MTTPGWLKLGPVRRRPMGGLEIDVEIRTWHPSWWLFVASVAARVAYEHLRALARRS